MITHYVAIWAMLHVPPDREIWKRVLACGVSESEEVETTSWHTRVTCERCIATSTYQEHVLDLALAYDGNTAEWLLTHLTSSCRVIEVT